MAASCFYKNIVKEETFMKKFLLIGPVLVVLLFIAGCATDKGLFGFIATTDYVKEIGRAHV